MNEGAWTPEQDARLAKLWAEGMTTKAIGELLGRTKNSIVGRSHRLLLPSRPSPIKWGGKPKPRTPRRAPRVTLQPLKVLAAPVKAAPVPKRPTPAPPAPKRTATQVRLGYPSSEPCCWPIGTPRTPSFRYCDAPTTAGRPYCEKHVDAAYVGKRKVNTAGIPL